MMLTSTRPYRISEIFYSFQGEGLYTGVPAIFIRFFGCNLRCNFGGTTEAQKIDRIEDFVVPERGCDSGYAWMPEMDNLVKMMTLTEIVEEVVKLIPAGTSDFAVVYTGGEPMLKQEAIKFIHDALDNHEALQDRIVSHIVETNGTVTPFKFTKALNMHYSISPKLMSVSNDERGIRYESLQDIITSSEDSDFILKFVMDNRDESWNELEEVLNQLEDRCFGEIRNYVYIMPMGADYEHQTSDETEAIVRRALAKGYKISLRSHIYVFKNKVGS